MEETLAEHHFRYYTPFSTPNATITEDQKEKSGISAGVEVFATVHAVDAVALHMSFDHSLATLDVKTKRITMPHNSFTVISMSTQSPYAPSGRFQKRRMQRNTTHHQIQHIQFSDMYGQPPTAYACSCVAEGCNSPYDKFTHVNTSLRPCCSNSSRRTRSAGGSTAAAVPLSPYAAFPPPLG